MLYSEEEKEHEQHLRRIQIVTTVSIYLSIYLSIFTSVDTTSHTYCCCHCCDIFLAFSFFTSVGVARGQRIIRVIIIVVVIVLVVSYF